MKIREYNPDKPGYGRRLTDQEWLEFKPILTALNDKGISRRQIIATAADEHGFEGTYAAMNIRFKEWGLTQPKAQQEVIFEYEPALDVDASESPATPSIPYVSSAEGSLESTNGSTFSTSNVLVPSLPESLEFWSSDSNLSSRRKEPDQQLVQLMQCSSRPRNGHTLVQMELISKSSIEPSILRQLVQAQDLEVAAQAHSQKINALLSSVGLPPCSTLTSHSRSDGDHPTHLLRMLHVQADRFNRGVLNLVSDCFKAHRLASSLLKSVDSFRLSLATVEKLSDATSSREKLSSKRESADRAEGYRVWLQPMYCRLVEAQQSGLERLDCLVVQNVKIIDQLARLKADLGEESKWGTVDADSSTEASASNARHEATPQAERIFRQKRMRRDRRSDDQSVSTKSTLSSMRAFAREAKRIRQHRENEDNDRVSVMFSLNMSPSHHSDSFGYVTGFGAHLESLEEMDDAVDDASAASETSPEDVDQDDGGKDNMPRHDGIITIAEYHQLLRGMGWE